MRECVLEWVLSGEHCRVWEMSAALGSFENREKNRLFPLPRRLLSKPQSMWGISDPIGKPVSPHTLTWVKEQVNGRSWSTDKTWGFHLLLWGHTAWLQTLPKPLPLSCKRILLLDLDSVHLLTTPHFPSTPAFPQNYYYSQNQNSLWGWESTGRPITLR